MDKFNSEPSKLKALNSSDDKKNPERKSVSYYVDQLAMALAHLIEPERELLYVKALEDLTEKQLEFGFEKALKEFKPEFGRTFPAPAEIREWAYQWRPAADNVRQILSRNDKPEEDTYETSKEFAARIIAEMRAKIARGDYDFPKPPVQCGESYRVAAERLAAQRNGPSTIPEDPAKRRSWAHEKAKNMGWLVERESGDEA